MRIPVLYIRSSFDPGGTETLLLNLFNRSQDLIIFYYVFLRDGALIPHLKSDVNKYYTFARRRKFDIKVVFRLLKLQNLKKFILTSQ